jgi:hypothetical protein
MDQCNGGNPNLIPINHGSEEGEPPVDDENGHEEDEEPGMASENTDENHPYNSKCK